MRLKIKEREESRFSISWSAAVLFLMGAPFGYLSRNGAWLDWLEKKLSQIGFGEFSRFGAIAITLSIALAFCVPAAILAKRRKLNLQALRDAEANSSKTTALYLRPFFTDTKIQLQSPFYSSWSQGISLEPPFIGPEEFVGRVLEPYIDVRQVGGAAKTVHTGLVNVLEEETWQMAVVKAIRAASVTIILPSLTRSKNNSQQFGTSTIWELKYLVNSKQIRRTIVIMPKVSWINRRSTRKSWDHAREEIAKFGLILPEYSKSGGSVVFEQADDAWRPKMVFGQSKFRRKRFAAGLVEALKWQAKQNGFELLNR